MRGGCLAQGHALARAAPVQRLMEAGVVRLDLRAQWDDSEGLWRHRKLLVRVTTARPRRAGGGVRCAALHPPPTPGRLSSGRSLDCQSRAPPPHSGTRGVSSEGGARRCDQSRGAGTPTRAEPASDWSSTQKREQGARLPRASLPGAGACRAERAGEDRAAGARAAVRAGIARGAGQCAGGEGVRGQVGEASVRACETGAGAPPGALWPGGAG